MSHLISLGFEIDVTMPQLSTRGGNNAKPSETRARFIHAYEKTYGNISASCLYAGIDRRTYYRWMQSLSRVNRKFQKRIQEIRPIEKQLDIAEARLMEKVEAGDMRAIEIVLRKGKHRGYMDAGPSKKDVLARTALAYKAWLSDHQDSTIDVKIAWLTRFAEGSQVDLHELAEAVGLGRLMARRLGILESNA